MKATATTQESDLKIAYRRSDDTPFSKPLFVVLSKFETDSFPVRVRHSRLGQSRALAAPGGSAQGRLAGNRRLGSPKSMNFIP